MAKENKQIEELSEEELKQVSGGTSVDCNENKDEIQYKKLDVVSFYFRPS